MEEIFWFFNIFILNNFIFVFLGKGRVESYNFYKINQKRFF